MDKDLKILHYKNAIFFTRILFLIGILMFGGGVWCMFYASDGLAFVLGFFGLCFGFVALLKQDDDGNILMDDEEENP